VVYFIFLSDSGAPNVAGPGVTYLSYPSLPTGLDRCPWHHQEKEV